MGKIYLDRIVNEICGFKPKMFGKEHDKWEKCEKETLNIVYIIESYEGHKPDRDLEE